MDIYTSVFGITNTCAAPLKPGIGSDCKVWRRKIAKGQPLFKPKIVMPRSAANRIQAVQTCWRREPVVKSVCVDGERIMKRTGWRWAHDAERQLTVPTRVRCPLCKPDRLILLCDWWDHACTFPGTVLGDFHEVTKGAKETEIEGESSAPTPIGEPAKPAKRAPARSRGLNAEQASEVRRRALAGEDARALAKEFGISRGYIYTLKSGKGRSTWKETA